MSSFRFCVSSFFFPSYFRKTRQTTLSFEFLLLSTSTPVVFSVIMPRFSWRKKYQLMPSTKRWTLRKSVSLVWRIHRRGKLVLGKWWCSLSAPIKREEKTTTKRKRTTKKKNGSRHQISARDKQGEERMRENERNERVIRCYLYRE